MKNRSTFICCSAPGRCSCCSPVSALVYAQDETDQDRSWLRPDRRGIVARPARRPTARCWRLTRSTPLAACSGDRLKPSRTTRATRWTSPRRSPTSLSRRMAFRRSSASPTPTRCWRLVRSFRRRASPSSRRARPRRCCRIRSAICSSWRALAITCRRLPPPNMLTRTSATPLTCCRMKASNTRRCWRATSRRALRNWAARLSSKTPTPTTRPTSRRRSPSCARCPNSRPSTSSPPCLTTSGRSCCKCARPGWMVRSSAVTATIRPTFVSVAGDSANNVFFTTHALMDSELGTDGDQGVHRRLHRRIRSRAGERFRRARL